MPAALLDIDGTLLDSNVAHAEAWAAVFNKHGFSVSVERVLELIGMGSDKVVPAITGEERPELTKERSALFKSEFMPRLKPQPGARDLLVRLREEGWRLVIATSAAEDELGGLLKQAGVADLVDATTTSDDAESSKPDPDIIEAAKKKAGTADVLMLGDTPYDVTASLRAGVDIVAVRCGGWGDAALRGAIAVYDDPAHLLAQFVSSPFGRTIEQRKKT